MKYLKKYKFFILFAISTLFYLIWYWHDGIILTEDAPSYINMQSDREPLYCIFLWLLRNIFNESVYLDAAVILQCLIAGVAASMLTLSLQKRFSLNCFFTTCILLVQYGITLLNRFVAMRRYSYYNSIETEALSYSLWIFFILGLIGVIYDKNKKSIIISLVWSVFLISIRKQMLITLLLLFICLVYIWWNDKRIKSVFMALIVGAAGLAGAKLVDCSYNYMTRGIFAPHTGDSSFILGTELYLANEGMADDIKDDERRELFIEIMRRANEKEYNVKFAQKGWQTEEEHYSSSYDRIKFDIVMPVIREYQEKNGILEADREAHYNETASSMMKELLIPSIPKLVRLFYCNFIHGMITTVLKVNRILNPMAFLLYLAYICVFVVIARMHNTQKWFYGSLPFAVLVMLSIIVNVGLTSATIYCQMRYMLYNTGLFYQSGLVMLHEGYRMRRGKEN